MQPMDTTIIDDHHTDIAEVAVISTSSSKAFIEANTIQSSLDEIKQQHVIPVFTKDNEPVISHADFIEATHEVVSRFFTAETILTPSVRLSHPIKGRVPEAKDKPANQLLEHEKTIYFERMAFIIEIPSISSEINENPLSLTVGGVKAYNLDNLYSKKGADQHFKIFIGFQNKVCTNLCVWTDGFMSDLKVQSLSQLHACVKTLIENYNDAYHLSFLKKLNEFSLTEQQFAHLIGRSRMYAHLPSNVKKSITPLLLSDTQLGSVVKDFYRDSSFSKDADGNINLWQLYNLLTGANKSSYVDSFLDRSVNAFHFVDELRRTVETKSTNWFLN
jgi:hypothetical protein